MAGTSNLHRTAARTMYMQIGNLTQVAARLQIPQTTVRRYCQDLNDGSATSWTGRKKKREEQILELRRAARDNLDFDIQVYADKFNLSVSTLESALRGNHYKHLNEIEAPVIKDIRKIDEKEQARDLYFKGSSYNEIVKLLGVSKSSVSLWCRDLVRNPKPKPKRQLDPEVETEARRLYQTGITVQEVADILKIGNKRVAVWCGDLIKERVKFPSPQKMRNKARRDTNGPQVLTDENVMEMRKDIRDNGRQLWRHHAAKYGCSLSVISMAARGVTFKHLDHLEAPVEGGVNPKPRQPTKRWKKPKIAEELVERILEMKRADPDKWTDPELAVWMTEQTGRKYRANHIAILINNRDPALRRIVSERPPETITPKVKKKRAPMTAAQKEARNAKFRATSAALKAMIEAENRHEEWVKNGCPPGEMG